MVFEGGWAQNMWPHLEFGSRLAEFEPPRRPGAHTASGTAELKTTFSCPTETQLPKDAEIKGSSVRA